MKLGYTVWTWMSDEFNDWAPMSSNQKRDFEQALREVSDLGFQTIENFNFIADLYQDDTDGFNALLKKYGLEFANLYFYYSEDWDKDFEEAKKYISFMDKVGAKYMNVQGLMWKDEPYNRPTDKEKIIEYAKISNKLGALCKEHGIKVCLHPHANTPIFTEEQIDIFLANSDPEFVSLCLDTAHTTLAGMDTPKAFDKFADRIGYVHLKDLCPDVTVHPEWPMKRFRPLGQGTVDLRGVYQVLKKHGYDGILCVEIDYQPVCGYKTAMQCRQYIHDVFGL